MMDTFVSQIKKGFTRTKNCFQKFGVVLSLADLSSDSLNELELSENRNVSTENFVNDISGHELKIEIASFSNLPVFNGEQCSPMDYLKYVVEYQFVDYCTNLYVAFRIVLIMPMSVASAERSFSKLKLMSKNLKLYKIFNAPK